MTLEQYTNQLHLARQTRPRATTAKDGTFCVQLVAYSNPAHGTLVPWRLSWFGDDALGFWCQSGTNLDPGALLQVSLTHLVLIDGSGRGESPEIHAHINSLQVLPKVLKSCKQKQALALVG